MNAAAEQKPVFREINQEFEDAVREKMESIKSLRDERKETTQRISDEFTALEKLGASKAASKLVLKLMELDEPDLKVFDLSYQAIREIMGKPIQADLFEASVEAEIRGL